MKARIVVRVVAAAVGLFLLAWFAYAHADQLVTLHFGLFTLRRVSLSAALYGAVIVGMLIVLAVGLRTELGSRRKSGRTEIPATSPGPAAEGRGRDVAGAERSS